MTTENAPMPPAPVGPVEHTVRPRAWLLVSPDGYESLTRHDDNAMIFRALGKGWEALGLYALPPEAAAYLLRLLQQERASLDGFLAFGNERPRAKRLDAWIEAISGPNGHANRTTPARGQHD